MTTKKGHIHIGYFDNFKGENSIVISVDINGLLELEKVFLQLSQGLAEFDFSKLQHLDTNKLKLHAFTSSESIGVVQTAVDKYEWTISKEKWSEFREKLTALYRLGTSGHQYLDSDSTNNQDLQVVLSWNEQTEKNVGSSGNKLEDK